MSLLEKAWAKLRRDLQSGLPPSELITKSARFAQELATSKLYLRGVDEVGAGVRTLGRPHVDNRGFMSIGAHTNIRSTRVPVELVTEPGARLIIGPDTFINYGASLGCTASIQIGARCLVGPYVMIIDSAFHELLDRSKRPASQPVIIEDDVWLGAKVSVMPGVTIGRGAVVGTASVVTKDIPPFSVVAGVPARVVRTLDASQFVAARAQD